MERGIGTSRGIGIGHVLIVYNASAVVNRGTHYNADEEKKRFFEARKTFIEQTEELLSELEKKLGESDKDALVLKNQIYLARDITTENEVVAAIDNSHICAEAAFDDVCNKLIQLFSSMDNPDMQQRVTDIQDMRERMIQILQGTKAFDLTNLPDNTVIVADEIKPSMTASMDIAHVAGIVAEKGGDTAHASILARALEIPAVLSVKGILQKVKNGDSIIIDGAYGEVFINPTQRTFSIYEKKKKKYEEHIEELKTFINKSTETADGKKVMLAANIGGADEAAKAVKAGAEGVGLFRTEFLFLNKNALPTEEEQFEEYKKAAVLTKGMPLTIRTLDIGGDKDIPYMGLTKETNPFLGYRAIRFCLDRVDIFTTQLRAILRASAYGSIRIMIPMITSVNEVRQVKDMIKKICSDLDHNGISYDKNIQTGVMIETPAAAIMADAIAQEVDFFSIGTNDLTQMTFGFSRDDAGKFLDSYYKSKIYESDPFARLDQNGVGQLVKMAVANGRKTRPALKCGICGEHGGDPSSIEFCHKAGLDYVSCSPFRVPIARLAAAQAAIASELQNDSEGDTNAAAKEGIDTDELKEKAKKAANEAAKVGREVAKEAVKVGKEAAKAGKEVAFAGVAGLKAGIAEAKKAYKENKNKDN